jgi:glucokinase
MRIGIDLGGTKIIGGLVDAYGRVTARLKIPTEASSGYAGIVGKITGLIRDIIEASGTEKDGIERIGIAAAGQIEKGSHRIVFSPNLGIRNVPLKDDVERAVGITTFIENDVNAATYGEWRFGLKGDPGNVLGIFVGTGIGGGLILDGKIYRGFSNVGGEIGHMTVNAYGYPCHCGNTGCFEAYCGGAYVVNRVRRRLEEGYRGKIWSLIGGDMDILNTGHIEKASREGDEFCAAVWGEVVEYLGVGVASLVNILNPELIVFGGGVIFGSKDLMDEAKAVAKKRAMTGSLEGLRFEKTRLGEDAAIAGAAFVEE